MQYHSVPYKSITHFSVETAGAFDLDAELTIWISGGRGSRSSSGGAWTSTRCRRCWRRSSRVRDPCGKKLSVPVATVPAMDQRISIVTLGVADLGRARVVRRGSASRGQEVEETVFFQAGAMVLVLWGARSRAADSGVPDDGSGFDRVTLAQNVRSAEEVDAIVAAAADAGAAVTRKPAATFYGGYEGVLDLDGHAWEIAFNPSFTITDDGAVVLPDF